jgi:ankyrin repeat protein
VAVLICLLLLFLAIAIQVCLQLGSPRPSAKYRILHASEIGDVENLKILLEANPTLVNAAEYGETALHKAAEKGHQDVVKLLIATGAVVDANECGWTPLGSARNKEVAEILIAAGADVNFKNVRGGTPLHWTNERDVAEILIAKGADVNSKTNKDVTPLHVAIAAGRKDIANLLIVNGADIDIFAAAALGFVDKVKALLNENPNLVRHYYSRGFRPLHEAAKWEEKEVAELLLSNGADINAKDNDGRTALHEALRRGHEDLAKFLAAKGANLDIFLAAALGLTDTVDDFLKVNPQLIHAKDKWGEEPLHKAAEWGHIKIVQFLIAKGADISATSYSEEWTTLFWAIRSGHKDVAELLISKGANIDARKLYNLTPLQWAADRGRKDMVEFLIDKGADINAKTDLGSTPLHLAAEQGHKDIAKLLIDKGANINEKDNFGRTPFDTAVFRGRT